MRKYIHNVAAYVEENSRYEADLVAVDLDESTNKVTVFAVEAPVYKDGELVISGKKLETKTVIGEDGEPVEVPRPLIVERDFKDLKEASRYYEEMIHQLEQQDVIRNI